MARKPLIINVVQIETAEVGLELAEAHMAGMGRTPSRPAVAEDVRHLDRRP